MNATTKHELDVISRIRGEVMSHKDNTGINLFLVWGYPTLVVILLEFAGLMLWNQNWYVWLWVGIPLVGVPLMTATVLAAVSNWIVMLAFSSANWVAIAISSLALDRQMT